jgi:hypothetical protein
LHRYFREFSSEKAFFNDKKLNVMKFSTPVELPKVKTKMQHTDRIMVIGSCFSEHIGTWLQQEKFRCLINPFGILYNPISIHDALERIMEGRPFTQDELEKGDDGCGTA